LKHEGWTNTEKPSGKSREVLARFRISELKWTWLKKIQKLQVFLKA